MVWIGALGFDDRPSESVTPSQEGDPKGERPRLSSALLVETAKLPCFPPEPAWPSLSIRHQCAVASRHGFEVTWDGGAVVVSPM